MLQTGKESEQTEKQKRKALREIRRMEIEDIDDLIFRDDCDVKTHSER